jgi:hypothetical protein
MTEVQNAKYLLEFLDVDPQLGKVMFPKGLDITAIPLFTINDVSSFFFQRSAQWLRYLKIPHPVDEEVTEMMTPVRTRTNYRMYSVSQIEAIANTLYAQDVIDFNKWRSVMYILHFVSQGYGV